MAPNFLGNHDSSSNLASPGTLHAEGSEPEQILTFEKLYLQVGLDFQSEHETADGWPEFIAWMVTYRRWYRGIRS